YVSTVGPIENAEKAKAIILNIAHDPEVGDMFVGTVVRIMNFGAFVEFMPNRDGLLHISEISWKRLDNLEASGIKEGDTVTVKLLEVDKKTGKYRLSMRALQEKPEGWVEPQRGPRGPRREGGDRGPRREGGDRGPRRDNNRGPRRD
ncbi:MAG: S1 RNA-binding domain-containing protein, partial [Muribaculaceae bacterium]|nr:S1 RNA-binding domain-containing protein [Muribaculaceae bacterium]